MAPGDGDPPRSNSEPFLTSSQLEQGLNVQQLADPQFGAPRGSPSSGQSADNTANNSPEHSGQNTVDQSGASSVSHSRRASGETRPQRERHRVRFGLEAESRTASRSESNSRSASVSHGRHGSGGNSAVASGSSSPRSKLRGTPPKPLPIPRTGQPPLAINGSTDITDSPSRLSRRLWSPTVEDLNDADEEEEEASSVSAAAPFAFDSAALQADRARYRAERLSRSLNPERMSVSAPGSKLPSPETSAPPSPALNHHQAPALPKDMTNLIPLEVLQHRRKKYGIDDETDSEDEKDRLQPEETRARRMATRAKRMMQNFASGSDGLGKVRPVELGLKSGQTTPVYERGDPDLYVPRPETYKGSILGALLGMQMSEAGSSATTLRPLSRAYSNEHTLADNTPATTPGGSPVTTAPPRSGTGTPNRKAPKWHEKGNSYGTHHPTTSLTSLIASSNVLAAPGVTSSAASRPTLWQRPRSAGTIDTLKSFAKKDKREKDRRIKVHIEDILARQGYIIDCCRALMRYGAPTHRLEEYMRMLSRVLEIKGQFLYIPGCMLIAFDDPTMHTTEMKIVRETQGVDLGKLLDMHDIYKAVTHDKMGVKDASELLEELAVKKQRYNPWLGVIFYGFASATVGPFAFGARPIDMPIAFILGAILGVMQLILAPRSELYSNVFEIAAAVVTSFLARAFGSIQGGNLFCFSALAQSSIALILPGYMVLCAALELQSKNMVAGSVRMVYAIIYSLFLGFGITIGTAFYGGMDPNATSDTTCRTAPIQGHLKFIFVPFFTLCLILVNQAKWRQAPAMLIISFAGYVVNFFSAQRFANNAQLANTLGALAIGVLGNLYSRFFQGMSAAALMPAIFVQVPSGLAASGSLISGITSANEITTNTTAATGAGGIPLSDQGIVFNVGYSMIQIAVGLTVGLFFSSLIVYPFGKKRSGLFSF